MSSKQLYYCLFPEGQLESYVVAIMSLVKRERVSFYTYDLKKTPKIIQVFNALPELAVLVEQKNIISGGFVSILHYLDKRIPEPVLASVDPSIFAKEISVYTVLFRKLEAVIALSKSSDSVDFEIEKEFNLFCESCEQIAEAGYLSTSDRFNVVDCLMLGFVCMAEDRGLEYISLMDFYPNLVRYLDHLSSFPYKRRLIDSLTKFRISTPFWEEPDFDLTLYVG